MSDIAVLFGGPSPEHDVSILTGLQASRALAASGGSSVRAIYWSKAGELFEVGADLEAETFAAGQPPGASPLQLVAEPGGGFVGRDRGLRRGRRLEVDVVVNCCHGGPGEDGSLQGALDLTGIPYTGPHVPGAVLGMDKLAFGAVVAAAGLPALGRVALTAEVPDTFPGPLIVKPRFGGSSIGIEVVEDLQSARHFLGASRHLRRGAVIEPYRADLFDLQVALRSWPQVELSAVERPLRSATGGAFLGYADKYVGGEGMVSAPRELPAQLDPGVEKRLRHLATEVAALLDVRGLARLDFLSDGSALYVNEINTVPGSLAKYLWVDPPVAFATLLDDLISEAVARPTRHDTAAGADGSALRSAGTIAAKLG